MVLTEAQQLRAENLRLKMQLNDAVYRLRATEIKRESEKFVAQLSLDPATHVFDWRTLSVLEVPAQT